MSRKTKIKRYNNIYKKYKKNGNTKNILISVIIFLGVAAIAYLCFVGLNRYLNRERCTQLSQIEAKQEIPPEEIESTSSDKISSNLNICAVEFPIDKVNDYNYRKKFMENAKQSGKNAVVITLKNETGLILYSSSLSQVSDWGTSAKNTFDAADLAAQISDSDLIPIARISAFIDQTAPSAKRHNTYVSTHNKHNAYTFKSFNSDIGYKWLNLYEYNARKYICDIVKEIGNLGYQHVILDNVWFPNVELNSNFVNLDKFYKKSDALNQFFNELDSTNVSYIISYNVDVAMNDKLSNLVYGKSIKDYGLKKQAPIISNTKKLNSYKNNIEILPKNMLECIRDIGNGSIIVVPEVKFNKNVKTILDELKAYGIDSSIVLN